MRGSKTWCQSSQEDDRGRVREPRGSTHTCRGRQIVWAFDFAVHACMTSILLTPRSLYKKMGFLLQALPFSYVKEARAKSLTGSVFLCPFSYFWWVLYSSGSGFLCFEKGSIFCEVFAEGSLPERHTLVLKKGQFSVRCSPKAACQSVTPWF